MFAKSVLVTGCCRGLGLEWVKLLINQVSHVFAGCRSLDNAEELKAIAAIHKNVVPLELDITVEESIQKAVENISRIVEGDGLNCLINNAAICYRVNSFEELTADIIAKVHHTNVVGTFMMTKGCLPLLKQAAIKSSSTDMNVSRASIINITSDYASLHLTSSPDDLSYPYRLSQVALNMLTKTLSIEYKPQGILVASIHPGWVQTDMGDADATYTPAQAVERMAKVAVSLSKDDSGKYYGSDGSVLPW